MQTMPNPETELKIDLSFPSLRALLRSPWLRGLDAGRTVRKQLLARYHDTPDLALYNAGAVLRVRQENGEFVRCLKTCPTPSAVLPVRQEYDVAVPDFSLHLDEYPEPVLAQFLASERWPDLGPVFECRVHRRARHVSLGRDTCVEMDVDLGVVQAGERSVPICEIELEAVTCGPADLFGLAREIIRRTDGRLVNTTKSGTGFALMSGKPFWWHSGASPELDPAWSAREALVHVAVAILDHLRANEGCVLTDAHPEGTHQMRVAARRLRSVLWACKQLLPKRAFQHATRELRWILESLAPLRDLDVFVNEIVPSASRFDAVRAVVAGLRAEAWDEARSTIQSRRYALFIVGLLESCATGSWATDLTPKKEKKLSRPVRRMACHALSKRHERVHKLGKSLARLGPNQEHRFRVQLHRLRDAADFLGAAWPSQSRRDYVKRLRSLQAELGVENDVETAKDVIARLRERCPPEAAEELDSAARELTKHHAADRKSMRDKSLKRWRAFARIKPFWRE